MKILLIDNHALFRDGLRHVLRRLPGGVDKILEAGNFSDGLKLAGQNPGLDMVLLELKSPGCEGAISVCHFRLRYPHIAVVVVSSEEDCHVIKKAMNYGASGFLCKSSSGAMLLSALSLALSGSIHAQQRQSGMANGSRHDRRSNTNECGITARQMHVLKYLVTGLSNKEIAGAINLAEGTVKVHVAAVYQALRVKNRTAAVQAARQLGLMSHAQ